MQCFHPPPKKNNNKQLRTKKRKQKVDEANAKLKKHWLPSHTKKNTTFYFYSLYSLALLKCYHFKHAVNVNKHFLLSKKTLF